MTTTIKKTVCISPRGFEPVTMSFSPDGRWLITGDLSGWVVVFDTETGRSIYQWFAPEGIDIGETFSATESLAVFSPNSRIVVLRDDFDDILLMCIDDQEGFQELVRLTSDKCNHSSGLVEFSADSKLVLLGQKLTGVTCWNINDEQFAELLWSRNDFSWAVFSPDGEYVFGCKLSSVVVEKLEVMSGRMVDSFSFSTIKEGLQQSGGDGAVKLCISADGKYLLLLSTTREQLFLLDLTERRCETAALSDLIGGTHQQIIDFGFRRFATHTKKPVVLLLAKYAINEESSEVSEEWTTWRHFNFFSREDDFSRVDYPLVKFPVFLDTGQAFELNKEGELVSFNLVACLPRGEEFESLGRVDAFCLSPDRTIIGRLLITPDGKQEIKFRFNNGESGEITLRVMNGETIIESTEGGSSVFHDILETTSSIVDISTVSTLSPVLAVVNVPNKQEPKTIMVGLVRTNELGSKLIISLLTIKVGRLEIV